MGCLSSSRARGSISMEPPAGVNVSDRLTETREPYLRITWTDPVTGRRGYVVIDRLIDGIAGGGTRMREGVTLEEVERLAHTMSIKNGALRLPGGGAKA